MESAPHSPTASPRRRAVEAPATSRISPIKPSLAKKMPKAAVETTSDAFMVLFKALPGAVKSRIVELIDEYEDELDAQEIAAARAANPEDFDPANSITLEEYMSQRRARAQQNGIGHSLAA